jgi:hypothetical protein
MAALTVRFMAQGASLDDELLARTLDQRWDDEVRGKDGADDAEIFTLIMEWTGCSAFYDPWVATGTHPDSVPADTPSD